AQSSARAWACYLLLAVSVGSMPVQAAEPEFQVRSRSGKFATSPGLPRGERDADTAWQDVAALIALTPEVRVTTPADPSRSDWSGYVYWQEFSNRLLREVGLRFCEEFPKDARCWTWLQAARERPPVYLDLQKGWQAQTDVSAAPTFDAAA